MAQPSRLEPEASSFEVLLIIYCAIFMYNMQWCIIGWHPIDKIWKYRGQEMTSAENGVENRVSCYCYLFIIFHFSCVMVLKLNIGY